MEQDTCVVKVGEPYRMAECGKPVEYLPARDALAAGRGMYSGWYHVAATHAETGHHGVPARMVR